MRDPRGSARSNKLAWLRRLRRSASVGELLLAAVWRRSHPLFDAGFYLERRPDVARSGVNPLVHFLRHGAAEGSDPHPLFDTRFYLERRPDVTRSGANPLIHYLRHGAAEGSDPHPLFDSRFYLERRPDVARSGANPLVHYVRYGAAEGCDPHPLFDTRFYLEAHPEVADGGLNPLAHFVQHGAAQRLDPHPLFSSEYYLSRHPDVAASGLNPLVHFVQRGAFEGRDPHPLFALKYYTNRNPDVVRAGLNPLVHYVRFGAYEGRRPHPLFDPAHYNKQCRGRWDLQGTNALAHYLARDPDQAPDPHPLFDTPYYVGLCRDEVREAGSPLVHFVQKGAREGRAPSLEMARGGARGGPPEAGLAPVAASPGSSPSPLAEASRVLVAVLSDQGRLDATAVSNDPAVIAFRLFAATGYRIAAWLPASTEAGVRAIARRLESLGIDVVVGPGDRVPSAFLERGVADAVLLDGSADRATLARVMAVQPAARLLLLRATPGVTPADSLLEHFDAVLSAGEEPPCAVHLDLAAMPGLDRTEESWTLAQREFVKVLRRTGLGSGGAWSDRLERSARDVMSLGKAKADLVFLGMIPWHYRRQRPQHLSTELGRRHRRVLYVEPDFLAPNDPVPYRLEETPGDNVFCATLRAPEAADIHRRPPTSRQAEGLATSLRALLAAIRAPEPTVVLQAPFWYPVCQRLAPSRLVYDCMDLYGGFPNVSADVVALEAELLRTADLVVFSAATLQGRLPVGNRSAVVRNACEYARFAGAKAVRTSDRITVGYVGAIDRWLNVELVNRCVEACPEWDFVLVGSAAGLPSNAIRARPNVRLLGEVDYAEVAGLVAGFDVCVIPFGDSDLTRCVNPVKVYEYLAAGRPVVATPLPELQLLEPGLVRLAGAGDAFVNALRGAVEERRDAASAARRREWASRQTWGVRAEEFLSALQS